jgi:recombination DNA repair RAD52 pathway protein
MKRYKELFTYKLVSNDGWSVEIKNVELERGFEMFFRDVKFKMGLDYQIRKGETSGYVEKKQEGSQ